MARSIFSGIEQSEQTVALNLLAYTDTAIERAAINRDVLDARIARLQALPTASDAAEAAWYEATDATTRTSKNLAELLDYRRRIDAVLRGAVEIETLDSDIPECIYANVTMHLNLDRPRADFLSYLAGR